MRSEIKHKIFYRTSMISDGINIIIYIFMLAALSIAGVNDENRQGKIAKTTLAFVSIFSTFFASCGVLVDGYGCFSLIRCHDCQIFKNHIPTILFALLLLGELYRNILYIEIN